MSPLRSKLVGAAKGLGVISALGRVKNQGPVVLFYHGVEKEISDPRVQLVHMPLKRFELEMAYIKDRFEVISMADLAAGLRGEVKLHNRQALITLDDGYANVLTNAAPVLERMGLPYTLFISTRHIDEDLRWPTYYLRALLYHGGLTDLSLPSLDQRLDISSDASLRASWQVLRKALERSPLERVNQLVKEIRASLPDDRWAELDEKFASDGPLTWQQVDELHAKGVTIASHCHDHAPLHGEQDPTQVEHQLKESQGIISQRYGSCAYLSFPRGRERDITRQAVDMAGSLGYELAFSTLPGEVAALPSPYLIPRLHSPDHQSLDLSELKHLLDIRFRLMDDYRAACAAILDDR